MYGKMPSNERVVVPGPPAGGFQVAISAVRAWPGDEDLSVVPVSARALKISHLLRVLADEQKAITGVEEFEGDAAIVSVTGYPLAGKETLEKIGEL